MADPEGRMRPVRPETPAPLKPRNSGSIAVIDNSGIRWRRRVAKALWTTILLTIVSLTVLGGHAYVIAAVVVLQAVCFKEIIGLSFQHSSVRRYVRPEKMLVEEKEVPLFKAMNWYFFLCANYYAFGLPVTHLFMHDPDELPGAATLLPLGLKERHQFVSFSLYTLGVVMFVKSLKYGYYRFQFAQFGWAHMLILAIVTQAYILVCNIKEGLVWFLLPISIVGVYDVARFAYGLAVSRLPALIPLPHKYLEGHVAAALTTCAFSFVVSYALASNDYFICPAQELSWEPQYGEVHCERPAIYTLMEYTIPKPSWLLLGEGSSEQFSTVHLYPIQVHAVAMAAAGSFLIPWANVLTQAFKKAFFLWETVLFQAFHSALFSRVDSQLLMAVFTYVYYETFVLGGGAHNRDSDFKWLVFTCLQLTAEKRELLLAALSSDLARDGIDVRNTLL